MSRQKNQKAKTLVILDILRKTVGENNAISTKAFLEKLSREYEIPCDRRTLTDDIKLLQEYVNENDDYPFVIYGQHNGKENVYYSLPKREMPEFTYEDLKSLITAVNNLPLTDNIDEEYTDQLLNKLILYGDPEVQSKLKEYSEEKPFVFDTVAAKILIDWIKSLTFIKNSTISSLVETITRLSDSDDRSSLENSESEDDNSVNENFSRLNLYQFDYIFRAISEKKKITFKYFDPDENRNKIYRHDGAEYCMEPLNLTPNDGHYYLICYDPKEGNTSDDNNTRTFRIDRMDNIRKTDEPISKEAQDFGKKVRSLTNQTFRMFSGPAARITLEFGNKFISAIFDAFGDNAKIKRIDDNTCRLTTKIQLSPPFFAWLFTFGNSIKIIGPQNVIDEYKDMCRNMIKTYEPE